jgi:hypothetical protein
MTNFRPDLQHAALRKLAALHALCIRKVAIKRPVLASKTVPKPEEKKTVPK